MAELRIRVTAYSDRSLSTAHQSLIQSAQKATSLVNREAQRTGDGVAKGHKKGTDAAEKAYAKLEKEAAKYQKQMVREAEKSAREEERIHEKAERAKTRATERESRQRARAAEQQIRTAERANSRERTALARGAMRGLSTAGGVVGGAMRTGARAASGIAMDLLRGAGVDLDLGSLFQKNASAETLATNLSNSGYISNDPRNNQRADPQALIAQSLSIGKATGFEGNEALQGLIEFTGKTGDLATGRDILADLAKYSKATGTDLKDMVSAAGDVALALGDVPNKGEKIKAVMQQIAGQGKLGAVEIRDLASQMAKIAAVAGQIEGDVGTNIGTMGMFAQEARQRGGAASATQAATSAYALINTFKTPARAGAFKAATGKDVFNKQGMLRDPQQLVLEALRAKGMDPNGFKKIFANVQGARAVEGFATIYRQAGGGDAGEKAVRAEFDRMRQAALADAEILESFRRSLMTTESQANVFNNSLREMAQKTQDTVMPALVELAPAALQLAQTFSGVVTWLVGEEARVRGDTKKTEGQVDTAMGNTEKQLGRGYILEGQKQQNQEAERDAFGALAKARAEYQGHTQDRYSSTTQHLLKAADYTPFGFLAKKVYGQGVGETLVNRNAAAQDERFETMKRAEESWDRIHKTNQRVGDLIAAGIVVTRIDQPVQTTGPLVPPGAPGGTQPPPGPDRPPPKR